MSAGVSLETIVGRPERNNAYVGASVPDAVRLNEQPWSHNRGELFHVKPCLGQRQLGIVLRPGRDIHG